MNVACQVLTLASKGRRIFKLDVEREETGLNLGLDVGSMQHMLPIPVQVGPPPAAPVNFCEQQAACV